MKIKAVLTELRRELSMRERLYPDWVRDGKLSEKAAAHRKAAIREAIARLNVMDRQLNLLEPNN